jgi:hypothetical protein
MHLLMDLIFALAGSAAATLTLLVVMRYCWRRDKPLQEP